MNQAKFVLILFVCFLLQGTVMQVFSLSRYGYNLVAAPHFVVITVLFIGVFYSQAVALRYGLLFGLLIDMIYTDVWGVYAFCITLTVYLMLLLVSHFSQHLIIIILVAMITIILTDIGVYAIYSLIGLTHQNFVDYTQQHLAPTVIINTVFAIVVFYPYKFIMSRLKASYREE